MSLGPEGLDESSLDEVLRSLDAAAELPLSIPLLAEDEDPVAEPVPETSTPILGEGILDSNTQQSQENPPFQLLGESASPIRETPLQMDIPNLDLNPKMTTQEVNPNETAPAPESIGFALQDPQTQNLSEEANSGDKTNDPGYESCEAEKSASTSAAGGDEDKSQAEASESSGKVTEDKSHTDGSEPKVDESLKCNEKLNQTFDLDDDDDIEIIGEKAATSAPKNLDDKDKKSDDEPETDQDTDPASFPMIRLNNNIFEENDEVEDSEEEQDQEMQFDQEQISHMMESEMDVDFEDQDMDVDGLGDGERRPKRTAARIAANTIKVISSMEKDQNSISSLRLDPTYRRKMAEQNVSAQQNQTQGTGTTGAMDQNRCHQCRTVGPSQVVIRQFGADIHLCSNQCFVAFRNPDPRTRPLPCAKCGELSREENTKNYYWETMNFCSDVCVCEFQIQIGSKCSTCSRKTPWTCMGKYCVRFGSDIRQFCTAACLETYKKSARVCFHCQLDIKRLGNVVLANIPQKASPKEFCSQECVEMYLDANSIQIPVRPRTTQKMSLCVICHKKAITHKELVSPTMTSFTCSEKCWDRLLTQLSIRSPTICETCPKFINMDTTAPSPSFYVAKENKTYGFCSATCKNVYVLKSRQILSCHSCKVKKYNYDLIEYTQPRSSIKIAVCSLHCLPYPSPQVITMREQHKVGNVIFRPIAPKNPARPLTRPDVVNVVDERSPIQISNVTSLLDGSGFSGNSTSSNNVTVRQISSDDIVEILDVDGKAELRVRAREPEDDGSGSGSDLGEEWADIDVITIIEPPEPPEQRNKACQVWPIKRDKTTQTEMTDEFPSIEPTRPMPIFIPYPVFIPCPTWVGKQPCPVPIAMPLPIPVPIPVDRAMWLRALEGIATAMETVNMDSPPTGSPMVCDLPPPGTVDEEMMDTSSSGGKSEENNDNENTTEISGVELEDPQILDEN